MLIWKNPSHESKPNDGIVFAWLPKRVPEGEVWLELVHRTWSEAENYGTGGYAYRRLIPHKLYSEGRRAQRVEPGTHKSYCTKDRCHCGPQ